MTNGASDPFSDELVERFADLAHESWSGWMRYLFGKCVSSPEYDGDVLIPAGLVDRWGRQMRTPYAELPEREKESDREEARKYLRAAFGGLVIEELRDA
jgi:hypothetical protein